ncbi:MAG: hypothetical protein GDA43_22645 [Hormoscilla sp. SP5CHS1]|nr:hypothetical protein [Hormoscilla sp. SP12CHS1]MBC6455638.1 hypothetical protein [Hormoscilla sp. SP5CHS1]MBC6481588.1 hypothetical protein [Hormoscilla sp. GM7CHS1pb]
MSITWTYLQEKPKENGENEEYLSKLLTEYELLVDSSKLYQDLKTMKSRKSLLR